MTTNRKLQVLTLLATAGMLLLASSLSYLDLSSGGSDLDIKLIARSMPGMGQNLTFIGEVIFIIIKGFLVVSLAVTPFYIYSLLRSKYGRQTLATTPIVLIILFGLVWVGYQIVTINVDYEISSEAEALELVPLPEVETNGEANEEVPEIASHPWLVYTAGVILAVVLTFAAALLLKPAGKGKRIAFEDETARKRLGQEAEKAILSLRSGGDLAGVILLCYQRMVQVLEQERSLHRDLSMTPREFERALAELGLPHRPVRSLTALFEDVRYGNRSPSTREEDLALISLTEIVEFCKADNTSGLTADRPGAG
jgi:hypothetical protein